MDRPDQSLRMVQLQNFMCYDDCRFHFVPGVNAITGNNDKGKSTVLAAVAWVLYGLPAGDTVERWSANERNTKVSLRFGDGLIISRQRIKGINSYEFSLNGKTGRLEATGNAVPEEVRAMVALQDINFQGQANNLYPMQMTPGQFGALVNKHCRLHEIHETLSRVTSEVKADQKLLAQKETEMGWAEEEIQALNWVPGAEGKMLVVKQLNGEISSLIKAHTWVWGILLQCRETGNALASLTKNREVLAPKVRAIGLCHQALLMTQKKLEMVALLQEKRRAVQDSIREQQVIGTKKPILEKARGLLQEKGRLSSIIDETESVLKKIQVDEKMLKGFQDARSGGQKMKKEIQEQLPPICPLCGAKKA